MKSYFLKNIFMNNLFKSVILASALTVSPVSADNQKSTFATTVAINGEGIDFELKIAEIEKQILIIETKINILDEKNDLISIDRRRKIWWVRKRMNRKLIAERNIIRDKINNAKQNKNIILDKTGQC